MRKSIILAATLLLLLTLNSCISLIFNNTDPDTDICGDYFPRLYSRSLIVQYAPIARYKISNTSKGTILLQAVPDYTQSIRSFDLEGNPIHTRTNSFQQYANQHGDTTLCDTIAPFSAPGYYFYCHSASTVDLDSIHLTSSLDYDSLHPAGTPLDDLFTLTYLDTYNYIRNGYPDYTPSYCQIPILTRPVSELTPDDIRMAFSTSQWALTFTPISLPADQNIPIVITLHLSDGSVRQITTPFPKN